MIKHPKQTCTICPHQSKCWPVHTNTGKPVSPQNVTINLLICRLQMGINRDKSAANLLQLLRPGMIRLISYVKQSGNIPGMDIDQLLADIQSTAIEYLLYDYKIGDRGRATPYLFDPQQGFLTKWVKWIVGRNRRFYSHHELHNPTDHCGSDEYCDEDNYTPPPWSAQNENGGGWDAILGGATAYDPFNVDDDKSDIFHTIIDIIEDGITLNSNEYRVIKFCLANSNETNHTRHIDGLHIYLANLMGVSRPRITRLYKRARHKLLKKYKTIKLLEDDI